MQATNDRFCNEVVRAGNVDALAQVYTPDAKVLPPGAPMMEGLEKIKGFWTRGFQRSAS